MKHRFSTSEEGIKRVLADMFTSEMTFLTEICQNSQRAGATKIDIRYSEADRVLTIIDDGQGFTEEGWQSFFVVGRSGWSDEVTKEQKPFGFGCAACLFAATEIHIISLGQEVRFETEAFHSGTYVERLPTESYVQGASIKLTIKEAINTERLLRSIESVFSAFTIPVFVNGEEIGRPLALDSAREFIKTELGFLTLVEPKLRDSRRHSSVRDVDVRFILQGYKLSKASGHPTAWIHLHSNQFRARVPDRDCLIGDVSSIREKASTILQSILKQQLEAELATIGLEQFALKHWFEAKVYAPELIVKAPLPDYLILSAQDIPYEEYESYCDDQCHYSAADAKALYPDDLKGKFFFESLCICGIADYGDEDPNFLIGNYAFLVSNQFIHSSSLPAGHWLFEHIVQTGVDIDVIEPTIVTKGKTIEFSVSTAGYYNQAIVLCDSSELQIDGLVTLNDKPATIGHAISTSEAIWFDSKLYLPKGCNNLDAVCRQTVNMNKSEYDFELDEVYLEKVEGELAAVVRVKRGSCVKDLLRDMIQEHGRELEVLSKNLIGNTFEVSFANQDDNSRIKVSVNGVQSAA